LTEAFIREVIDRLARIESRAESYITSKAFGIGGVAAVAAILIGFWGIGQSQINKLDKRFQDSLKISETNIARSAEEYFKTERGAILDNISAKLDETLSRYPSTVRLPVISVGEYGAIQPTIDPKRDGSDWKFSYLSLKDSDALRALTERALSDFIEEKDVSTYSLGDFFVKDSEGNFVPAFPKK
jgi:hypothetical protein